MFISNDEPLRFYILGSETKTVESALFYASHSEAHDVGNVLWMKASLILDGKDVRTVRVMNLSSKDCTLQNGTLRLSGFRLWRISKGLQKKPIYGCLENMLSKEERGHGEEFLQKFADIFPKLEFDLGQI